MRGHNDFADDGGSEEQLNNMQNKKNCKSFSSIE